MTIHPKENASEYSEKENEYYIKSEAIETNHSVANVDDESFNVKESEDSEWNIISIACKKCDAHLSTKEQLEHRFKHSLNSDGRNSGHAFAAFHTKEATERAMLKDKQHMRSRYISLAPSDFTKQKKRD